MLHESLIAADFPDELRAFCDGLFKIVNNLTDVTYVFLPQIEKTFHTSRKFLIPYYPIETLFFPPIQSYTEQNPATSLDSDTSDTNQNDLHIM